MTEDRLECWCEHPQEEAFICYATMFGALEIKGRPTWCPELRKGGKDGTGIKGNQSD